MSRTDKDMPYRVVYPDGWWPGDLRLGGDSGFRHLRKQMKRSRTRRIRRYQPEAKQNGAKPLHSGLKRTWDFE